MCKASGSFGRLSKRVWQSHLICLSSKIHVYKAVVVPNLLHGAETWVLYRNQIRLLERFHQCSLCSILGIKWQDHVWNEEVLESQPAQHRVHFASGAAALGWPVIKMEDVRMPKAVFISELQE